MRAGLRTIPRIVAGLAALALLLGGCEAANRAAEGGGASEAGGRAVLEYGWAAGDLTTLDPHLASASQDRTLVDMVFGGLLRYEPGTDDVIEPDIARAVPRPEERGGKQVWRFDIRPGVMCHQGTDTEAYELTSDDVLYSLKRAADPNFSAFASTYAGMTFRKAGAQSVEVVLDQSLPPELFLPAFTDYAGGFIVCKKALEAMGDKSFATHPVGTGPFMFSNYTSQDRVELVAFDDYWRGEPELGGVTLRYMPDDTSRQLALERGDVHLISGVSDDRWVESIRSQ
ncbi:MAG: ABC transporter substrate-binding protein, partial [Actinomycetota bacterium]